MRDYDIKRGHFKEIEGRVDEMLEQYFGDVKQDGDWYVTSFGAMEEIRVRITDKTTATIDTKMTMDVDNETAIETREAWNDFLLDLTGFTAKKRRKRLKDKAKEGDL